MAAPATVTTKNFTGSFAINRTLSDSMVPIMKMQNIPWWAQQIARLSTVTTKFEHYTDAAGISHLDEHYTSGGVTRTEDRTLNSVPFERDVMFWGKCKIWAKYTNVSDLEDPYLAEGWDHETVQDEVVVTRTESLAGKWATFSVWGFAEVDGQRRYVRRIFGKKSSEEVRTRIVYDFVST